MRARALAAALAVIDRGSRPTPRRTALRLTTGYDKHLVGACRTMSDLEVWKHNEAWRKRRQRRDEVREERRKIRRRALAAGISWKRIRQLEAEAQRLAQKERS